MAISVFSSCHFLPIKEDLRMQYQLIQFSDKYDSCSSLFYSMLSYSLNIAPFFWNAGTTLWNRCPWIALSVKWYSIFVARDVMCPAVHLKFPTSCNRTWIWTHNCLFASFRIHSQRESVVWVNMVEYGRWVYERNLLLF